MPGILIHLDIAESIHKALTTDCPAEPLFTGALAPDFGFYPDGYRRISDLAHHCSTGRLVAALLDNARTENEKLFALGWLSHYFADIEIHPLVNAAAGSLPKDNPEEHIRVELGLDVYYARGSRSRSVLEVDTSIVPFLHDAFSRVYSEPFDIEDFNKSFSAAMNTIPKVLSLMEIQSYLWGLSSVPYRHTWFFLSKFVPLKLSSLFLGPKGKYKELVQLKLPSPELLEAAKWAKQLIVERSLRTTTDVELSDLDLDSALPLKCASAAG